MRDDEKLHSKGGIVVMVAAMVMALIALRLGVNPLAAIVGIASAVGAATVEGAQWVENRSGAMPTRDVSIRDWAWSAGPGLIAAASIHFASRAPTWPEWLR